MKNRCLTLVEYQCLTELRHQIRQYLHAGELAARRLGLQPRQHEVLLAIKGLPAGIRPRVCEVAEQLQIQHHSAVELVNRLVSAGYLKRQRENGDRREVLLALTPKAQRTLGHLADYHYSELTEGAPELAVALRKTLRPAARAQGAAAS